MAVETEERLGEAAEHEAQAEGEDQPHQQGIPPVPGEDAVDQRLKQVADRREDDEHPREEENRLDMRPLGEVEACEGPQHDPLAHGEIDHVHHPVDQGESDGDDDVDRPQHDPVHEGLRQQFHVSSGALPRPGPRISASPPLRSCGRQGETGGCFPSAPCPLRENPGMHPPVRYVLAITACPSASSGTGPWPRRSDRGPPPPPCRSGSGWSGGSTRRWRDSSPPPWRT